MIRSSDPGETTHIFAAVSIRHEPWSHSIAISLILCIPSQTISADIQTYLDASIVGTEPVVPVFLRLCSKSPIGTCSSC